MTEKKEAHIKDGDINMETQRVAFQTHNLDVFGQLELVHGFMH
jgi:hypothetical protein